MGRIRSSVIGPFAGPQPALIHAALLAVLKYAGFSLVLFFTSWPTLITYLLAVLLAKSVLDFVLAVCRIGRFGLAQVTQKGRVYMAALELVPCAVYLAAVLISWHFLQPQGIDKGKTRMMSEQGTAPYSRPAAARR